jgi:hypothetical protein
MTAFNELDFSDARVTDDTDRVTFTPSTPATHRVFETGATRDSEDGKLDFEGFLSPAVIQRYGEYMDGCRHLPDGTLRDSDNWQQGIPITVYMKSKWRHFLETWTLHRKGVHGKQLEDSLCAELFNTMGMLHEELKLHEADKASAKELQGLKNIAERQSLVRDLFR